MIAIDPSSGSSSAGGRSVAGWAVFDEGHLVESGLIEIEASNHKADRFRDLLNSLQTDFDKDYDVLALEDIPLTSGRRRAFTVSQTLIQVCGVYIAGLGGHVIEMNTRTFQAIANRLGGWFKDDEMDAIFIGIACICFAEGYNQTESDQKKLKKLGEIAEKYNYWGLEDMRSNWEA